MDEQREREENPVCLRALFHSLSIQFQLTHEIELRDELKSMALRPSVGFNSISINYIQFTLIAWIDELMSLNECLLARSRLASRFSPPCGYLSFNLTRPPFGQLSSLTSVILGLIRVSSLNSHAIRESTPSVRSVHSISITVHSPTPYSRFLHSR